MKILEAKYTCLEAISKIWRQNIHVWRHVLRSDYVCTQILPPIVQKSVRNPLLYAIFIFWRQIFQFWRQIYFFGGKFFDFGGKKKFLEAKFSILEAKNIFWRQIFSFWRQLPTAGGNLKNLEAILQVW